MKLRIPGDFTGFLTSQVQEYINEEKQHQESMFCSIYFMFHDSVKKMKGTVHNDMILAL